VRARLAGIVVGGHGVANVQAGDHVLGDEGLHAQIDVVAGLTALGVQRDPACRVARPRGQVVAGVGMAEQRKLHQRLVAHISDKVAGLADDDPRVSAVIGVRPRYARNRQ
jgi:hypothetical protein